MKVSRNYLNKSRHIAYMRGEYPKGGSDIPMVFAPLLRGGESPGGGGESLVSKIWANSSTSLKIISCPPKYEFAPQMRPQILNPCAATGKGFRVAEQTNSMDYGNRLKSETLCQRLKSYYFPGGCKDKKILNKKREPLLCQRHTEYTSKVLHIRYLV
jgi:hypothetical protein